jgi:anti-sigma regulatory factor (Ser/Thr protein kinase)
VILELYATPEEVMRGVEVLREFARSQGVPEKAVFDLALVLEECGSNIVNHALQRDPARSFQAAFHLANDSFLIELRDDGPEFDPTSLAKRKARADDDDLPGGWGVELVRRFTDEIRYARENGENILCLIKRLG